MSSEILLAFAVIFNVAANMVFRHASATPGYPSGKMILIAGGLFLGLINTLCYLKALEKIPLGTAFPVFSAASIVLIAGAAGVVFGETWSAQKIVGLITICVGIVVLGRA